MWRSCLSVHQRLDCFMILITFCTVASTVLRMPFGPKEEVRENENGCTLGNFIICTLLVT
jgi:hypothetical protein